MAANDNHTKRTNIKIAVYTKTVAVVACWVPKKTKHPKYAIIFRRDMISAGRCPTTTFCCETWRQYPGACFSMEIRSMWLKKYGPRLRLLTGSGLAYIKSHWHLQNIMFNRKMEPEGVYWKPLKYEMNTSTNYLGNCNFNYEYIMKFHWTSTDGNCYQDHFNIQVVRQCILLFL